MALQKKQRTNESFIQKDDYLDVLFSLGIPTASDDYLDADGVLPFKLIYNTVLRKLRIYDTINEIWQDASPADLTNFYTKDEIDTLFTPINETLVRLSNIYLSSNPATSEIYLMDGDNNVLSTLSVGFLNNEGSHFVYNDTTNSLDLLDEEDNLLASVPIGSFLTTIANQISFNSTNLYILELKDASNVVLSTVNITIDNVQNLQAALNDKEPTITILPVTKGGTGLNTIVENEFYIGGPGNTFINKTPAEILELINGQVLLTIGDGLQKVSNTLKIVSASSARIIINTNNIDLAQTAVTPGTYTKVTVDNYGRVTSATNVTASDIATILQSIVDLSANGLIFRISSTGVVSRVLNGTSGRINITNADGVAGPPTFDLAPTSVVPGTYNGITVDPYGRITNALNLINTRRHAFVSGTPSVSYNGKALAGSSESALVWTIYKIVIAADGTTITTSATNASWTNYLTTTYT
jgi:hypothetical protein